MYSTKFKIHIAQAPILRLTSIETAALVHFARERSAAEIS
jgi:hypothetical protein